jgi:glycosyltransferase involved in cell wall biosynthesis
MYFEHGGRHYWLAENLINEGYSPTIFCASTIHNTKNSVNVGKGKYVLKEANQIPFVFIKTSEFHGNGLNRLKNMFTFYKNILSVTRKNNQQFGEPDVILASSPQPFALIAGMKIAKRYGVPSICEIRDLWPKSIVAYGILGEKNLLTKILYRGERWIYKKADSLIFTMEGVKDYIKEKKWDDVINLEKIYHISNGLNIKQFDESVEKYKFDDTDLDCIECFKVIYTGSIRRANSVELLINAAQMLPKYSGREIRLILYGDGTEKERLEKLCEEKKIYNVIFKGKIELKFIPYVLSKADLNILHNKNTEIMKYGGSQRKLFEYLASGKLVLSTITMGYDIIKKYDAGITLQEQSPETISKAISNIADTEKSVYNELRKNARKCSYDYDFAVLSKKLIKVIEKL